MIKEVMEVLNELQRGLAVEYNNAQVEVVEAWRLWPSENDSFAAPSWLNNYTLIGETRSAGFRELTFSIQCQLLVYDANIDVAADICALFLDAWIELLDKNTTLKATCNRHDLRGGEPTLGVTKYQNIDYAVMETYLDVYIKGAQEFS